MNKTTITGMCALAVWAGPAVADLVCLPGTYAGEKKQTLNLNLGYATKYVERGLALRDSETDNIVHGSLTGVYKLGKTYGFIGGVKVNQFIGKGFDHYDESSPLCDEGTVLLQYSERPSEYSSWALGYQFVHGGLPGYLHSERHHGGRYIFNSRRPEEHSIVLDIRHDFYGVKGLFWESRSQYSFRWEEGWYFSNTLGYEHELSECTSAVLELTWTATWDYFEHRHLNSNGTQGWELSFSLPMEFTERTTVTPYVSGVLSGNGADAAGDFYRNHTVVFGVDASWNF